MYNSYTVSGLSRLWLGIKSFYKYSVVKKLIDTIINGFKLISSGSYVVGFFTSDKSLIESSIIYSIYRKLICLIESLLNKLRSIIKQYKKESFFCKASMSIFESTNQTIGTISLFVLSFSLVNIAIDALNNNIKTFGNAVLFLIIMIFLVVFKYKANASGAIENSLFIKLLKDIFTIDDGGDQWW